MWDSDTHVLQCLPKHNLQSGETVGLGEMERGWAEVGEEVMRGLSQWCPLRLTYPQLLGDVVCFIREDLLQDLQKTFAVGSL